MTKVKISINKSETLRNDVNDGIIWNSRAKNSSTSYNEFKMNYPNYAFKNLRKVFFPNV
jgi:hypothetical protein